MQYIIKNKKIIFDALLFTFVAIILFLVRDNLRSIITPFIYALVLAYLLNPLVNFLERKELNRIIAILVIFIGIILALSILFMSIIPKLANDLLVFDSEIPNIFIFIESIIDELQDGRIPFLPDFLVDYIDIDAELARINLAVRSAFSNLSTFIIASTGTLLDIVMTPIITFYYLKDKERLLGNLSGILQQNRFSRLQTVLKDINRVLGGFIRGQLIVAMFVGILTGVGSAVIGVPYSLTIGFVAGVTNIVPYFGPWIGGIVPVLLALMISPIMALWVTIWIIIVQQIESSFISPQVLSHSVGLHPLTVIFSVLFFGNMFGIIGMIIGVPLMGTIKVLVQYIWAFRKEYRAQESDNIVV